MITTLINKQDNFEIIRDQIAAILVTESANQQTLAVAEGEDPALWKLRVYTERSNPWEAYRDDQTDKSPIVNVWFDNSSYQDRASNVVERQKSDSIFNIDCYGCAVSSDVLDGGHTAGDAGAAFAAQRALRLVRNILMAGTYTYLNLRGLVWMRMPQSITMFQPEIENRSTPQIVAGRMAFSVAFNEFSPQVQPETLELLTVQVTRQLDGQIVLNADYDYT